LRKFQVALTADFYNPGGEPKFADLGLSVFDGQPQIAVRPFAEHRPQIAADQLAGANGVIVLTPAVTRETVSTAGDLLAIGRFGVGYDNVDVAACTAAYVLL
jgi:phosphoglycerate dehydrogenase-like enzyme